jgi:hypothetical protein
MEDRKGLVEITPEWWDNLDREYKNSWRWKYIDRFVPDGFDGYNLSFFITKPWEFPKSCYRHAKWAWQRVFRGWDDRVTWSLDSYLSEMIPQWLEHLKATSSGVPMDFYEEKDWTNPSSEITETEMELAVKKFNSTLDEMSEGFLAYKRIQEESLWTNNPEYEGLNNKFNKGMELFVKYFSDLWD